MQRERWAKVKEIFDEVILFDAPERGAFLDKACGDDGAVRREVESLLKAFASAENFLETPLACEIAGNLFETGFDDGLTPGQLFGRYKIIRRIGGGGMGQVYLAEDTELKRS